MKWKTRHIKRQNSGMDDDDEGGKAHAPSKKKGGKNSMNDLILATKLFGGS